MSIAGSPYAADDHALDARLRFEDLVDRNALEELGRSVYALFGIPLRVFSEEGKVLTDAASQQEVCGYANSMIAGRAACASTVSATKSRDPGDFGETDHPCFTGASYKIVAIEYDGRRIGKMVIGPYLPAEVIDVPRTFLQVDPAVEPARARSLLLRMPRVKSETITRIARHVKATLDLIFFSGHKSLLTSQMHLASVTEGYRELAEKTARLQEAYDRLKELDRLKSNFLATVSHELRTPLTSIIGYSEMLGEGIAGEMNGEQREFVGTIREKGEHLLQLIVSLLDLSKLESGTMTMRTRVFSVEAVLQDVLTTVLPAARKKGVEVTVQVDGEVPQVRGDPERLRQVVLNLVDNGVKFTPAGGKVIAVARAATLQEGDEDEAGMAFFAPQRRAIAIRVADTGIGIPAKERPRVFDAFYQVDSSSTREYGGAGLGLAIVKRLVEAHDGTITVEANAPAGTVFTVTIPVPTATSAAPPPGPPGAPPSVRGAI